MANQKISELTALLGADVAALDLLPIVDTSASSTKKITAPELKAYIFGGSVTVTAAGRALLDDADASAQRTTLGLGTMALVSAGDYLTASEIAVSYQPLDSDLTAIAALATTSYGRSFLTLANAAALRTSAGLVIGTDVQAYSSVLANTTASFTTAQETKLGHITVTQAVDLDAIETRVNALDAAVILKGTWDASAGTFPGSGSAQAGESWIVSIAGTVNATSFAVGDRIIAITDNASTSTFANNWFKADYTDQVLTVAGRTGAVVLSASDISDASANGQSLITAANYAAMRTLLSLVPGTDFYSKTAADAAFLLLSSLGSNVATFLGTPSSANLRAALTDETGTGAAVFANMPTFVGSKETVYTITDGAAFEIDPANGGLQEVTLGASRTPKATNFASGQSVVLRVADGTAYTLTWSDATWGGSGVVWESATAPTLATTGWTEILLYKRGTQVYGKKIGDFA